MQSTASIQRQMPNTEKIPKTAEIIHVVLRTAPGIQEIRKIVELPQVLFMVEVVGMPVVMSGKCVRQTRKNTWKLPQIPYNDKILGVSVAMQHQVPTAMKDRCKMTRGAHTGLTSWLWYDTKHQSSSKSAARSSGRRGSRGAATDHRRSDAPMNTRSRSGR